MSRGWLVRATAVTVTVVALAACTKSGTTSAAPTATAMPSATPSARADPITVPKLTGLSPAQAIAKLRRLGLAIDFKQKYGAHPYGSVVAVRPREGSAVRRHSTVMVWIGRHPPRVPDVVGMSPTEARKILEVVGYRVVVVGQGTTVLKSNPPAGTRRLPGMKVTITVWTPPPAPVPAPIVAAPPPSPPCIPKITC